MTPEEALGFAYSEALTALAHLQGAVEALSFVFGPPEEGGAELPGEPSEESEVVLTINGIELRDGPEGIELRPVDRKGS